MNTVGALQCRVRAATPRRHRPRGSENGQHENREGQQSRASDPSRHSSSFRPCEEAPFGCRDGWSDPGRVLACLWLIVSYALCGVWVKIKAWGGPQTAEPARGSRPPSHHPELNGQVRRAELIVPEGAGSDLDREAVETR